jgi:prophage maintenance system killer protein
LPSSGEDFVKIKHTSALSNTNIEVLAGDTNRAATITFEDVANTSGVKFGYEGLTDTVELNTNSNGALSKKIEIQNTPTGYVHFHNAT